MRQGGTDEGERILVSERGSVSLVPIREIEWVQADDYNLWLHTPSRAWLLRADSPAAAGIYAVAVKLATLVIVAVRGFQYAWPPLAYSIVDEDEARHLYALVTTAYVVVTGLVVAGLTLLGRWVVRLLTADPYFPAHKALPWVALSDDIQRFAKRAS